jgi:membrane fusion protein, macrolide-specific efflux system
VTIAVTGSPPGLHLGASAQAEITTEQITDAVLVPSAAVHGTGRDAAVTVLDQGEPVSRPVTVGVTSGGRTQITQGLTSGEQVVLPAGASRTGAGAGGLGGLGGRTGGAERGGGAPTGGTPTGGAPASQESGANRAGGGS